MYLIHVGIGITLVTVALPGPAYGADGDEESVQAALDIPSPLLMPGIWMGLSIRCMKKRCHSIRYH